MCGTGMLDKYTGVLWGELWSLSCGDMEKRNSQWNARVQSDRALAQQVENWTRTTPGIANLYVQTCQKAEPQIK
jgi:hypothetical protein